MFFRRLEGETSHRRIALVRDVVEIMAILAAGIWAIYVFIYTDRIEPYQNPVAPVVTASMSVDGVKGDLLAIRLMQSIKNPGPGRLYLLGSIASVVGLTLPSPREGSLITLDARNSHIEQRFAKSEREHVYAYVDFQHLTLDAGQEAQHSFIIYVSRRKYDTLVFDPTFAYSRQATDVQLKIVRNSIGIPFFGNAPSGASSEMQMSTWRYQ